MIQDSPRRSLFREWSALVPIAMSLAGLAMVLLFGLIVRPAPQADEGAPARIFQLLMTLQLPVVAFFAIRWLPGRPRAALPVLIVQGIAWLAAVGAVMWLEGAAV